MTDLTAVPWRVGTHYGIHLYAGGVDRARTAYKRHLRG